MSSLNDLCDFEEKDMCMWSNVETSKELNWLLTSGPSPSKLTGPSFDHTLSASQGMLSRFSLSLRLKTDDWISELSCNL